MLDQPVHQAQRDLGAGGAVLRQLGLEAQFLAAEQRQPMALHSPVGHRRERGQAEARKHAPLAPAQDEIAKMRGRGPAPGGVPRHRADPRKIGQPRRQPSQRADHRQHPSACRQMRTGPKRNGLQPLRAQSLGQAEQLISRRQLCRLSRRKADQIERQSIGEQLQPGGSFPRAAIAVALFRRVEANCEAGLVARKRSDRPPGGPFAGSEQQRCRRD